MVSLHVMTEPPETEVIFVVEDTISHIWEENNGKTHYFKLSANRYEHWKSKIKAPFAVGDRVRITIQKVPVHVQQGIIEGIQPPLQSDPTS